MHEDHLNRTNEAVRSTHHSIDERLDQGQAVFKQTTHNMTEHLTAIIAELRNLSKEQFEVIVDRLRQIENRKSPSLETENLSSFELHGVGGHGQAKAEPATGDRSHLSASLDRLCLLASSKADMCYSLDAEEIIDNLECILDAILLKEREIRPGNLQCKKRMRPEDEEASSRYRGIRRVRGILTASRAIELGNRSNFEFYSRTRQRRSSTRQWVEEYDLDGCTAVVSLKTDDYSTEDYNRGTRGRPTQGIHSQSRGHMSIMSNRGNNTKTIKISARFLQQLTSSSFSSLNPKLMFHPIIPDSAEIFVAVKAGDVDRMVELFNDGKASLHDCDCEGRSLLNVSILISNRSGTT